MKRILFLLLFTMPLFAFCQICKQHAHYPIYPQKLQKKNVNFTQYDILFQHIHIHANPKQLQMTGKVVTHFKAKVSSLSSLSFHLDNNMQLDSVVQRQVKLPFTHNNHVIDIQLNAPLNLNDVDSLTLYYRGDPTKSKHHGYFVEKHGRDTTLAPIIWTLSQPYGAQDWWPCKNTLDDKIDSLNFSITCPMGNMAVSHGILHAVDSSWIDSTLTYHWQHRYPISTYLVAFAITNYERLVDTILFKDGRKLAMFNYVYPESLQEATSKAPEINPIMLLFDSLFGAYPFKQESYGHAQFSRGGGMEHQTISFMSSWDYDLVAHELAHQWFGDKITCSSWEDIWLNEGFATYLTALCYNFLKPAAWVNYMGKIKSDILKKNDGSVFVADTTNVGRMFDGRLTYDKGAMLLQMLRLVVGDSVFFKTLKTYINHPAFAYSFVSTRDLQTLFEKTSQQNLETFFANWFYGEGYPLYNIVWKQNKNSQALEITQSSSTPITTNFEISIPLLFKGEGFEKLVYITPQQQKETYYIDLPAAANEVLFDPYNQILAKGTIISSGSFNNNLKVYPNPANQKLTFSLPTQPISKIELINSKGQVLLSKTNEGAHQTNMVEIDISELQSGLYFYRCQLNKGVGYGKVEIIKR